MPVIDFDFGQELCDQVAKELDFVCSFMGDRGTIMASSDRERIGKVHNGAARIMRGEVDEFVATAEEAAKSSGMREGITVGVDFEGKRKSISAITTTIDSVNTVIVNVSQAMGANG